MNAFSMKTKTKSVLTWWCLWKTSQLSNLFIKALHGVKYPLKVTKVSTRVLWERKKRIQMSCLLWRSSCTIEILSQEPEQQEHKFLSAPCVKTPHRPCHRDNQINKLASLLCGLRGEKHEGARRGADRIINYEIEEERWFWSEWSVTSTFCKQFNFFWFCFLLKNPLPIICLLFQMAFPFMFWRQGANGRHVLNN